MIEFNDAEIALVKNNGLTILRQKLQDLESKLPPEPTAPFGERPSYTDYKSNTSSYNYSGTEVTQDEYEKLHSDKIMEWNNYDTALHDYESSSVVREAEQMRMTVYRLTMLNNELMRQDKKIQTPSVLQSAQVAGASKLTAFIVQQKSIIEEALTQHYKCPTFTTSELDYLSDLKGILGSTWKSPEQKLNDYTNEIKKEVNSGWGEQFKLFFSKLGKSLSDFIASLKNGESTQLPLVQNQTGSPIASKANVIEDFNSFKNEINKAVAAFRTSTPIANSIVQADNEPQPPAVKKF